MQGGLKAHGQIETHLIFDIFWHDVPEVILDPDESPCTKGWMMGARATRRTPGGHFARRSERAAGPAAMRATRSLTQSSQHQMEFPASMPLIWANLARGAPLTLALDEHRANFADHNTSNLFTSRCTSTTIPARPRARRMHRTRSGVSGMGRSDTIARGGGVCPALTAPTP